MNTESRDKKQTNRKQVLDKFSFAYSQSFMLTNNINLLRFYYKRSCTIKNKDSGTPEIKSWLCSFTCCCVTLGYLLKSSQPLFNISCIQWVKYNNISLMRLSWRLKRLKMYVKCLEYCLHICGYYENKCGWLVTTQFS